jgi:hypothetical protein
MREDPKLCPACALAYEAEEERAARPLAFRDGSVPTEIERAAIASFTFDNFGPEITWDTLDEADRSFHREAASLVVAAWLGAVQ